MANALLYAAPPPSDSATIIYVQSNHMVETVNVALGFGIMQNKISMINHSYDCLVKLSDNYYQ